MTNQGDLEALEKLLQSAEQQLAQGPLNVADQIRVTTEKERSEQRSRVTAIIIWTYAIGLAVIAAFLIAWGLKEGAWQQAAEKLLDLVKTALIPVVTFVIGHYFGSSR